jgi:hypothetical protein
MDYSLLKLPANLAVFKISSAPSAFTQANRHIIIYSQCQILRTAKQPRQLITGLRLPFDVLTCKSGNGRNRKKTNNWSVNGRVSTPMTVVVTSWNTWEK